MTKQKDEEFEGEDLPDLPEQDKPAKRLKLPKGTTTSSVSDADRYALKRKVRMFYDIQRLRLQTGGRTKAQSIQLLERDQMILDQRAEELLRAEKNALHDIEDHLKTIGFYRDVLNDKKHYRGIGPTLAGVILAEFDIKREDTVSKMWAFAGLRPMPARRCKKCHTVVAMVENDSPEHNPDHDWKHPKAREGSPCDLANKIIEHDATYASGQAQRPQKGEKLPYNAFLKMKLVGVMAGNLLKAGSHFRSFYDNYKHRKESMPWGMSDGHRHNAALRYMVKMVLLDIWTKWRAYEGLPVRPSYQEEKLGHVHSG